MNAFAPWKEHFERNALRPLPPVRAPTLSAEKNVALAQSLARFALGESGEGRIAHEIDSVCLPGVDADYRAALKLFVAEEGRHARILGKMVNALGGQLLARSWTQGLFIVARRAMGVRFKLLVLLAAEVIGIGFYGLLSGVLPEGETSLALAQICGDEEMHLKFHCQFLGAQRTVLQLLWWPLGTAAVLAVLWDHRHTLKTFEVPLGVAAARLFSRLLESAQRMKAQGAPALTQLKTLQTSASLK
jgi:hypothetical protein